MRTGAWVRTMISGVVGSIALCAVLLFTGCTFGLLGDKQCENGQERAFGVLTALLTTVLGLGMKLDALDEPTPRANRSTVRPQSD